MSPGHGPAPPGPLAPLRAGPYPGRAPEGSLLVVDERIRIPLRELAFRFVRSPGPGGQRVNKVATKAVLRWHVAATKALPVGVRERFLAAYARRIDKRGFLTISSSRFRDRGRNVADCLQKLRTLVLAVAAEPKQRIPTKPTKAARARRIAGKKRRARTKALRRPPPPDET